MNMNNYEMETVRKMHYDRYKSTFYELENPADPNDLLTEIKEYNTPQMIAAINRSNDMDGITEIARNENGKRDTPTQQAAVNRLNDKDVLAEIVRNPGCDAVKHVAKYRLLSLAAGENKDLFPELREPTIEELHNLYRPLTPEEELKIKESSYRSDIANILSGHYGF